MEFGICQTIKEEMLILWAPSDKVGIRNHAEQVLIALPGLGDSARAHEQLVTDSKTNRIFWKATCAKNKIKQGNRDCLDRRHNSFNVLP
jgi:hypothetical protein